MDYIKPFKAKMFAEVKNPNFQKGQPEFIKTGCEEDQEILGVCLADDPKSFIYFSNMSDLKFFLMKTDNKPDGAVLAYMHQFNMYDFSYIKEITYLNL